jgi:hypothetical protein
MMEGQTARPSAWMISLGIFLARGQIVFFVWVTFGERKRSILAERRGLYVVETTLNASFNSRAPG